MDKIYIFGHKNPDTDSVVAAISLAYLKNVQKKNATPYILGEINNETKYVLNYFKVNKPMYLNDVKLEISDLNYKKNCFLEESSTLYDLYDFIQKEDVSSVPICTKNKDYLGMLGIKDILKIIINPNYDVLKTSYSNILKVLKGTEITKFRDNINGKIFLSEYKDLNINLSKDTILIIKNNPDIIKKAIEEHVELIIIVGSKKLSDELLSLAKKNKVNIISTNKELLYVSKMIILSNYIKNYVSMENVIEIDEKMYVNDFLTIANKYKYPNYPVVNYKNKILGLLRMEDVNFQNRKKVILVDHNEYSQSVSGIEEADIIEIIDHHKVGSINSSNPINIRNMAVGSTNTIIYEMYKEKKIKPPKDIAGLMLAGIISDTLFLNSPTTTIYDRRAYEALSKIAKIDPIEFSKKMFQEAASVKGKTIEELIYNDFKSFNISNRKIGIGQMTVIDYKKVLNEKDKYLEVIEKISREQEYDIFAFCITDILNSNTYLLYNEKSKTIFETIFNVENIPEGYELKGIVSRKMQIVPLLTEELK